MEKLVALLQSILEEPEPGREDEAGLPPVTSKAAELAYETDTDESGGAGEFAPSRKPSERVFRPATLPQRPGGMFYEFRSNAKVIEDIQSVIEAEGPVSEAVLCRRVARAWGLERTGARIVERVVGLIPRSHPRTRDGSSTFYWPSSADPHGAVQVRVSGTNGETKRHVHEICTEETASLIVHVLESVGACPMLDVARSVCRLVGMARTPADAEARVASVVASMLVSGRICERSGRIQLS